MSDFSRHEPIDPMVSARGSVKALPKRFYRAAEADVRGGAHVVLLDGRSVRAPTGTPLAVPTARLAQALADEWQAQGEFIEPLSMPLTRLVNSALDGVRGRESLIVEEMVGFAGSDLIFYRAESPLALRLLQMQAFDPVLDWARSALGADFATTESIGHIKQSQGALGRVRNYIVDVLGAGASATLRLSALGTMTSLTGSALLPLFHIAGQADLNQIWIAAHIDEDFQITQWGADEEAATRRAGRLVDMKTASFLFDSCGSE